MPKSSLLFVATYGAGDPTRATLPFLAAVGALEAGHLARMILMGDAAALLKDVDRIHAAGMPPLKDLIERLLHHNVPIYVSSACARVRHVTDPDLAPYKARWLEPRLLGDFLGTADATMTV